MALVERVIYDPEHVEMRWRFSDERIRFIGNEEVIDPVGVT